MSCKVEEDIDPISEDLSVSALVAGSAHVPPDRRSSLKTRRQFVFDNSVAVANRFELAWVKILKSLDQKIPHRVSTEIGRNEAYAKPTMWIAIVFMSRPGTPQRFGVQSVVFSMGRGQFSQGYARTILNCEQKIAVRLGVIRFPLQRLPIECHGFVVLALILEDIAQAVERIGVVRLPLQRLLITLDSFGQLPFVLEREPRL